jgi:RNA polymerase primary sigma factor
MPPARRSATKKAATRATKATASVRARAASTRAATRREVEQSIARFEKQLEGANDALKTLGGHLGGGAKNSYKDVTAALTSLRREAAKTNKQALKDFDKLRAAITQKASTASRTNSRSKASSTASKKSSGSAAKRTTAKRTTAKRATAKRTTSTRAKKSS